MRSAVISTFFLTVLACTTTDGTNPGDNTGDTDPPATNPEPPDIGGDDTDAIIEGDEGSIMLVRKEYAGRPPKATLYGLFVDEQPGYHNLASCAANDSICIDTIPPFEDDYIDVDDDKAFDPDGSETRFLGTTIGLGPYEADYIFDQSTGIGYYERDITDEPVTVGQMGVTLGLEWGEYSGYADITVSEEFELLSPELSDEEFRFHNGQIIEFEWVPLGEGQVYLSTTSFGQARMYLLNDDGYFALDADSLGFGVDPVDLNFTIGRWNQNTVRVNGNELNIVAASEVSMDALYFYVGTREEIVPADACYQAEAMQPITETGGYWGRLVGYEDDLDPAGIFSCTGWPAVGREGMIPITIKPNTVLTLEYHLPAEDASIYLVEDCSVAGTCIEGADDDPNVGGPEYLSYFNETTETQNLFLVLDAYIELALVPDEEIDFFTLDVTIEELGPPPMYDTCPEAENGTPLTAGSYYTDFLPFTNQLNPGSGGCTGTSVGSEDSMTRIELGAGEELTVTISMPGGDPAMYLLYNCTQPFSCIGGVDVNTSGDEAFIYTNTSAFSENLYLVIDSVDSLQPYFLTVVIQ